MGKQLPSTDGFHIMTQFLIVMLGLAFVALVAQALRINRLRQAAVLADRQHCQPLVDHLLSHRGLFNPSGSGTSNTSGFTKLLPTGANGHNRRNWIVISYNSAKGEFQVRMARSATNYFSITEAVNRYQGSHPVTLLTLTDAEMDDLHIGPR